MLEAQLNCRADQLATAQHAFTPPTLIALVPPMPSVPVQLVVANSTITSKHLSTIRQHATSGPLLKHIALKINWTPTITALVDWKLHSSVVKKFSTTSISKYLHQCLPVQSTLCWRNQASSPICLRCHLEDEDDDHIIHCSCSDKWRRSLFQFYLTSVTQHQSDVQAMEYIVAALECHYDEKALDITTIPHRYCLAFQHQAAIGWSNWYKGRVAKTLTWLFPRQPKQKSLLPHLLSHTLRQWTTLWSLRNEIVHGHHESSALSEKNK